MPAQTRWRATPHPPFGHLPLRGEGKVGIVPRDSPNKQVLPRIRKLSPLCTTSLLFGSPGLPVLRGVSGGGAALSSLCRRFPGGDIMNLTSRRSPLSGLSFSLFFFLRRKKKRLLAATQSQNLCRQIKPRQLTAQFPPRWGKINYTTSVKTKAPYTSAPAGCYPPCPLSPAPSRLLSPCPLPVSRRCKAGFS